MQGALLILTTKTKQIFLHTRILMKSNANANANVMGVWLCIYDWPLNNVCTQYTLRKRTKNNLIKLAVSQRFNSILFLFNWNSPSSNLVCVCVLNLAFAVLFHFKFAVAFYAIGRTFFKQKVFGVELN